MYQHPNMSIRLSLGYLWMQPRVWSCASRRAATAIDLWCAVAKTKNSGMLYTYISIGSWLVDCPGPSRHPAKWTFCSLFRTKGHHFLYFGGRGWSKSTLAERWNSHPKSLAFQCMTAACWNPKSNSVGPLPPQTKHQAELYVEFWQFLWTGPVLLGLFYEVYYLLGPYQVWFSDNPCLARSPVAGDPKGSI